MAKTLKFQNGDMVRLFTNSGYEYVSDGDKVKQDVALMLTSGVRGSTGLGCGLDEVVGEVGNNPTYAYAQFPIVFEFQTRLRVGLDRFKSAQRRYQFSQRTPKELVYEYTQAEVWIDPVDPRSYRWSVNVITEDGSANFSVGGGARV